MKVVLRKDVPSLGKAGEVHEVADGYGRNYLIPRGLAAPASKTAVANVEAHKAAAARQRSRAEAEWRQLAQRIAVESLTIKARTGEQGRLYGSVTAADISDALSLSLHQSVDKHDIVIDEPIRTLGPHKVRVHVAPNVTATLTVVVEADH